MDESAADRRRPRPPDDPEEQQGVTSRRVLETVVDVGRRCVRRLRKMLSNVGRAVRHAGRVSLGRRQDARDCPRRSLPYSGSSRTETLSLSVRHVGSSDDTLTRADFDPSQRTPARSAGKRRERPRGDGRLQMERTPERLILYDPDSDEAYLASTAWADVES